MPAFFAASHFLTAPSNSALTLAETLGGSGCLAAACCCCCACSIFSEDGGLGAVSFFAAAVWASSSSPLVAGCPAVAQPTADAASSADNMNPLKRFIYFVSKG